MDEYGIYTAADANFFPGVVVQLNALRLHGYYGKLAVIDTGLDPWMIEYLIERGVILISMGFARHLRFTDVLCDEPAGMRGWSFKAFGIMHARLFKCFTYIDADYIPLCNLEQELHERVKRGEFLSTEDGWNTWTGAHADATGVTPGTYPNVNAGFFSASMDHHGAILEEWRNLMTRRKPFDLWYGDQGALNAVLDKYGVPKAIVGDKRDWNQTWLNEALARDGSVTIQSLSPPVLCHKDGRRIWGWHGCGWHRYWHALGIDHYRKDEAERQKMYRECAGKLPEAVLEIFSSLLFHNNDLVRSGHLLAPRPDDPGPLAEIYARSFRHLTDKGTAHSYIPVYERLLAGYRRREIALLEIGVWTGGSLLLWSEYFETGKIIGFDINLAHVPSEVAGDARIALLQGNAACAETANRLVPPVDIVIDDGSHHIDEQLASFRAISPKLKPGGLYVIEDVQSHENASRLQREIPDAEIIDRRAAKGRYDDILLVYRN